jgi:hypothetical protein
MKRKIFYLIVGAAFLISACEPIEKRQEAGPIVPAEDFVYTITNDATHDYIVYLNNKTPEVMFSWDYAWGSTRKQMDTVHLLVPGTYTVKITALTAGGIVTTTKSVTVTEQDPDAFQEPQWAMLTNMAAGKTWVWNDALAGVWGNGGFKGCNAPCWWVVNKAGMSDQQAGNDEMTFDLNGGYHLTLKAAARPAAYKGTTTGTFNLSFAVFKEGWDVGKLTTTNVTVPLGVQVNFSDQIVNEFYVLKLTDTELNLSAPEPGVTGDWGTAWFWMFKPKP